MNLFYFLGKESDSVEGDEPNADLSVCQLLRLDFQ